MFRKIYNMFSKEGKVVNNIKYNCIRDDSYYDNFYEKFHKHTDEHETEISKVMDNFYNNFSNLEISNSKIFIKGANDTYFWVANRWYANTLTAGGRGDEYRLSKKQLARLIDLVELFEKENPSNIIHEFNVTKHIFVNNIAIPYDIASKTLEKHLPQYFI